MDSLKGRVLTWILVFFQQLVFQFLFLQQETKEGCELPFLLF
jgi:hypothetical protein